MYPLNITFYCSRPLQNILPHSVGTAVYFWQLSGTVSRGSVVYRESFSEGRASLYESILLAIFRGTLADTI